jgi:excinuclease UvrABC nuclease subunit
LGGKSVNVMRDLDLVRRKLLCAYRRDHRRFNITATNAHDLASIEEQLEREQSKFEKQ